MAAGEDAGYLLLVIVLVEADRACDFHGLADDLVSRFYYFTQKRVPIPCLVLNKMVGDTFNAGDLTNKANSK